MSDAPEDWLKQHGKKIVRIEASRKRPVIQTASELMAKKFDPIQYVVKGVITEGLTLLAGKPKCGKSYWALGVALAVAQGGVALSRIDVEQGDVLYLALEDTDRRLHNRIDMLTGFTPQDTLGRLQLATKWAPLHEGGLLDIKHWAANVERPRLVVVDVLAKVRPAKLKDEGLYDFDYRAIAPLKELADEKHMGALVLHHTSKRTDVEDPFDAISGTTGLTGVADSVLVIKKTGQGSVLYGRGREMPEIEQAMNFNKTTGAWILLGNANEVFRSETRQAILKALNITTQQSGGAVAQQIADITGIKTNVVRVYLQRMVIAGEVEHVTRGRYCAAKEKTHWATGTDDE